MLEVLVREWPPLEIVRSHESLLPLVNNTAIQIARALLRVVSRRETSLCNTWAPEPHSVAHLYVTDLCALVILLELALTVLWVSPCIPPLHVLCSTSLVPAVGHPHSTVLHAYAQGAPLASPSQRSMLVFQHSLYTHRAL